MAKKSKKAKPAKKNKYPSRIACQKCNVKKGVRPDIYEKRIAEYGTEFSLLQKYTCTSCRKKHNLDKFGSLKVYKPQRQQNKSKSSHNYDKKTGEYILPEWMRRRADEYVGVGPEHFIPLCSKGIQYANEALRKIAITPGKATKGVATKS